MEKKLETTISFYDEKYAESTVNLNMGELYAHVEKYLPKGASVLDAGCGSGRDSKHFIEAGYDVTAFDASETMCKCASQLIRQEVRKLTFQEMDYTECFDGIWACASLLHVSKSEIISVLHKIYTAIKPGGVLYASWKYGENEWIEGNSGRFFCNMNENSLLQYFQQFSNFVIEEIWQTKDVSGTENPQIWINIIVKRNR